jgi:hypothetical protein
MTAAEVMGRAIAEASWDRAAAFRRGGLGPRRLLRWETIGDQARANWTAIGARALAELKAAGLTDETAIRLTLAQVIFGLMRERMRASELGIPRWAAEVWSDAPPEERADYFAIATRAAKARAQQARAAA